MIDYLYWHYIEKLYSLLIIIRNFALFPLYFFAVSHHISTLFSPWKRQYVQKNKGFSLENIFQVISFNIISRILGAIMRSILVIFGILLIPFFLITGIFFLILWIVFPLISLSSYFSETNPKEILRRSLLHHSHNTTHLLIALMKSPMGFFVLHKLNLEREELLHFLYSEKRDITTYPHTDTPSETLYTIAQTHPIFTKYLEDHGVTAEDIKNTCLWYEDKEKYKKSPLITDLSALRGFKGIGADWSYGYTPILDKYSKDLVHVPTPFPLLIGREKELRMIEQGLLKTTGNSVLLVGEPGTARHQTVETFAYRILAGRSHKYLSHKRVLQLDMNSILSGHQTQADAKSFLLDLLDEAEHAGNVIVVIDEIDQYLTNNHEIVNLSDIILMQANRKLGLIALTTEEKYRDVILPQRSLEANFEKISILPPPIPVLFTELELSIVPVLDLKYHLTISYQALKRAVDASGQYLSIGEFPEKTIRLLDSACQKAIAAREHMLEKRHIDMVIEEKLHISVGVLAGSEKERLLHLEELLKQRVIDQDTAISALANTLRRSRLNISNTKRPIGSFLFLGPTGVGKTETAKALAQVYFEKEGSFARFDMSQYQNEEGMLRLIGSSSLNKPGELTTLLTEHPASVILFDELEKTDTKILNLLLTLLDEGYITDFSGKKITAQNSIIIGTSNAGSEFIRQAISQGLPQNELSEKTMEHVLSKGIYSPEFINRFDSIVVFKTLSEGSLREVAKLKLLELNKRLQSQNIQIEISPKLLTSLANIGYHPEYGARNMQRTITEVVENQVAKRLLEPDFKKDEVIQVIL